MNVLPQAFHRSTEVCRSSLYVVSAMEELRRMESGRAAAIPADDLSGAPLSAAGT